VREELDRAESKIARIAGRQHGVVSVAQLRAAGIGKNGITRRLRAGRLHRLHRGVYAVGHTAPSEYRRFMAAVLASGKGAVLSHQSAAYLWGFLRPKEGPVHVTSPSTSGKHQRAGILLHRSPSIEKEGEVTRREWIPVTAPRRTIEDLEQSLEPYLIRRAKRQAEFMRYKLRLPSDRSRSDLESDFLAFCRRHRLPRPEVNVKIGKYTVDFLWRQRMVAVETDFFDYHRGSVAFEEDHEREFCLRRLGYIVRRYTGAQLDSYPKEIAAELGEALSDGPLPTEPHPASPLHKVDPAWPPTHRSSS
jgi:very-short-patch-repair endonuclease